jgi:site-specific recombinase XerD
MLEEMRGENSEQNVLRGVMPMMRQQQPDEDKGPDEFLLQEYEQFLSKKAEGTIDAYVRTTRHVMGWVAQRPGNGGRFHPRQLTKTAVEVYLASLEQEGFSLNHRARVKSTISSFARWLIEEKGLLQRNPTRGVDLPSQQVLAPRQLSKDQRYILRSLVEQAEDWRGAAIFALGYWAGCRVSDISWLQMAHTHVGPKVGWVHIGYKGGKWRDIDLMNEARKPLYEYLRASGDGDRTYVFTSQRSERLTEEGIHYWFRTLKAGATKDQWAYIHDLTFHDLRHDFAHRAREAGWSLEEVAYYLGHVTKKGTPAIQTTVRYTQASREQVKEKLRYVKG